MLVLALVAMDEAVPGAADPEEGDRLTALFGLAALSLDALSCG